MDPVNNIFYIVCRSYFNLSIKNPQGTSGDHYPDTFNFASNSYVLIFKDDVFYKKVILDDQTQSGHIYQSNGSRESDFNRWGYTDGTYGSITGITIDSDGNAYIGATRYCAGWASIGYMLHYVFYRVTTSGALSMHYSNDDTVGNPAGMQWDAIFGTGAYRYNFIPSYSKVLNTQHVLEVTPNG
jgi:hypothetical protein